MAKPRKGAPKKVIEAGPALLPFCINKGLGGQGLLTPIAEAITGRLLFFQCTGMTIDHDSTLNGAIRPTTKIQRTLNGVFADKLTVLLRLVEAYPQPSLTQHFL